LNDPHRSNLPLTQKAAGNQLGLGAAYAIYPNRRAA